MLKTIAKVDDGKLTNLDAGAVLRILKEYQDWVLENSPYFITEPFYNDDCIEGFLKEKRSE